MLGILKSKPPFEQEAKSVYAQCLSYIRQPVFYQHLGIADTMEARFDLLLLHIYPIIERNLSDKDIDGATFNQCLFDIIFKDMDQTLREMGIGDMGVPKRMRKMMTGFNGRMHAYASAFEDLDATGNNSMLAHTLSKNIYACDAHDMASALADHILLQRQRISSYTFKQLTNADPLFTTQDLSS